MTSQYATSRKWILHINGSPTRMEEIFFIILISDDSGSKNLLGFLMVHCNHLGKRSAGHVLYYSKKVLHHLIFTTFLSNVLYHNTKNIF